MHHQEIQLADVLTKGLPTARFQDITNKLGMEDIHSPILRESVGIMEVEDLLS